MKKAIESGSITTLIKAEATIASHGCGPCLGTHQGLLAPREVCASTSSRNFQVVDAFATYFYTGDRIE